MPRKSAINTVFRFRIELQDIAPPIWREIEVPGSYSFWDLHVAIQDAMGWQDYHLHAFLPIESSDWEIGIPFDDDFADSRETLPGWEVPVVKHFHRAGDRMVYNYDFGDGWTHDVVLEEITASDSKRPVACTAGERACPPEDCGGPWGYQILLEALADPAHEQHEDMKRWIGDAFEAERFNPAKVKFDNPTVRWKRAFSGD
jgi:hypothetical protein